MNEDRLAMASIVAGVVMLAILAIQAVRTAAFLAMECECLDRENAALRLAVVRTGAFKEIPPADDPAGG